MKPSIRSLWSITSARRALRLVQATTRFLCTRPPAGDTSLISAARGPLVFGSWVMIVVFVFFGLWASIAPLSSASVAQGVIVLDASRKTIQHLEGGIIDEILVQDGDKVEANQVLLRLSGTAARASHVMLTDQLNLQLATQARLLAARDAGETIVWPEPLASQQDTPQIKELLGTQTRLFTAQQQALQGRINVLEQHIAQSTEEITGLRSQEASARKQLAFLHDEIDTVRKLLAKGNSTKPRLLALEREAAEVEGKRGGALAGIARAEQSIGESKLEVLNARNDYLKGINDELKETQAKIPDVMERQRAAADVLKRIDITAPQSGVVTGLAFHTKGGVIPPGTTIMEIVPQDDKLVVDARIHPRDIDEVHSGLQARLRLSSYKSRRVPILEGQVVQVSADRFVDKVTNEAYYTARLTVDESVLKELKDVTLYPGMPVEVLIVTGRRTLLSYLLSPLSDSTYRAFREE